ncbi:MAG: hypothetical protein IT208_05140 [Chthonomonadales bacterium]|nr:hypothetical protein [Chthonomonadales bacterium]
MTRAAISAGGSALCRLRARGALLSAFLLLGPGLLQYRYIPGSVTRYRVEQTVRTTLEPKGGEARLVAEQASTIIARRQVVRSIGGKATVEETPVEGQVRTRTSGGAIEHVVDPVTRIFTYARDGRCLGVARRAPQGVKDPGPQFLDGLSFPLPLKPTVRGMQWKATLTARGARNDRITIRFTGRYLGEARRGDHPCAHLAFTFKAAFRTGHEKAGSAPAGTIDGTITQYFARDIGQDAEVTGTLRRTVPATATAREGATSVRSVTTIRVRQALLP